MTSNFTYNSNGRVCIINSSDYSPFGVTLDGRTVEGSSYRYSFGGMEKDDEIKGFKNSYNFGARMLDPRVGRWLSLDPLSFKQPDQSPYKGMLNNPIYWKDPDGKTEYKTIIVKSAKTGKVVLKTYTVVSQNTMTDGVKHEYMGGHLDAQYAYDYRHVTYITENEDGTYTYDGTETEVLQRNGTRGIALYGEYEAGTIFKPKKKDDPYEQNGGWYMTSSKGEGTKYHAKHTEYIGDIDLLLSAIDKMSKAGKGGKIIQGKGMKKLIRSLIEREVGIVERAKEMKEEWDELHPDKTGGEVVVDDSTTTQTDHLDAKSNRVLKTVYVRQSNESIENGEPANEENSRTWEEKNNN